MSVDTILSDIAPEFDTVSSEKRARFIGYASAEVSFGGASKDLATAYLAAHMLSMAARTGGAAGQVTSETEGSLSRSYGSVGGQYGQTGYSQTGYSQTGYGQEFMRLLRSCNMGMMTRAGI